jgi:hypothetical protein
MVWPYAIYRIDIVFGQSLCAERERGREGEREKEREHKATLR